MAQPWHDINSPGFAFGRMRKEQPNMITEIEAEAPVVEQAPEHEVRLISAKWQPGPDGFQYNKSCFLEVKAEFLKDTVRARITGKLFARYNGEEHDLCQELNGELDRKTGIAKMEVKYLFFVNNEHNRAWARDKTTSCEYLVKDIRHTRGENDIESPALRIPPSEKAAVDFVEIPDVQFHSGSAIPCIDQDGALISALVAAFRFAANNRLKTVVLFGHTDTDGQTEFNNRLSRYRAIAAKSLLDDDTESWREAASQFSTVSDYQQCFAALTAAFGWLCDPGSVDNLAGPKTEAAARAFQSEYNDRFGESIQVDGRVGPQTWGALHEVIRTIVVEAFKEAVGQPLPSLQYGNEGSGIFACGDSFPIEGVGKDQYVSRTNRRVEIAFWDGQAEPVIAEPADATAPVTREKCTVFDEEKTEKRAIEVTETTVALDGEVFYDTGDDELGIVKPAQLAMLEREFEWMDSFTPHMKAFLSQDIGRNEKDHAAQVQAVLRVMKEFVDAEDDASARRIIEGLDARIAQVKDQILAGDQNYADATAAGHKMKPGDVRELFWVGGKRMVRVRGKKIRSHNRWFSKKQVLEQIRKEHREEQKERAKKKGSAKEAELKLFEKKLLSADGSWGPEIEEFNKKCHINFFENSAVLDGSMGAQFLRHSAEAVFGATANWKEDKAIKIGAKAEGSFALAQAQGAFDVNIPDENGFELLEYIRAIDKSLVDQDSGEIFLLLRLRTKGSAFVGACASISLDLGVSMKENQQSGGLETGVELFAGAKAGADTTLAMNMKLLSDEDMQQDVNPRSLDWTTLADVTYGAWAAIGIGAEASIKLGYYDNALRFLAKIGLVLKFGAGAYLKGSVDPVNGGKMIWTVAQAMNWKHMSDVLDDEVHDLYQALMANCFLLGETLAEVYDQFAMNVDEILRNVSGAAERGLGGLKAVDDTFDEIVPGYTGFKQFNANFLLLKSTYHYLKQRNREWDLKSAAIDAVETAEREGRWQYATWQMKVNLIYNMRFGGAGIGGFSEERKEDAVIAVLRSARHADEFKKIVDSLARPDRKTNRETVDINELLDFEQQQQYEKLKTINGYKE